MGLDIEGELFGYSKGTSVHCVEGPLGFAAQLVVEDESGDVIRTKIVNRGEFPEDIPASIIFGLRSKLGKRIEEMSPEEIIAVAKEAVGNLN